MFTASLDVFVGSFSPIKMFVLRCRKLLEQVYKHSIHHKVNPSTNESFLIAFPVLEIFSNLLSLEKLLLQERTLTNLGI